MTNTALASLPSPSSITDAEAMPWVPIATRRSTAMTAAEAYRRGCAS